MRTTSRRFCAMLFARDVALQAGEVLVRRHHERVICRLSPRRQLGGSRHGADGLLVTAELLEHAGDRVDAEGMLQALGVGRLARVSLRLRLRLRLGWTDRSRFLNPSLEARSSNLEP